VHGNPGILESHVKVCLVILLRVLVVRLGEERIGGEERLEWEVVWEGRGEIVGRREDERKRERKESAERE